jgi:hypothetical protein
MHFRALWSHTVFLIFFEIPSPLLKNGHTIFVHFLKAKILYRQEKQGILVVGSPY